MNKFDIVAFICIAVVIYMVVGSIIFISRQLKYNLKFTFIVFISVILGLGLICCYNYFKKF